MDLCRSPDHDFQTRTIIGAAMQVHRILGHGFAEVVYQDALAMEFGERAIPFEREASLGIVYRGLLLPSRFRVDFCCYDAVVVELKALSRMTSTEESQVINYLKASGKNRALLLNFGGRSLGYKRYVGRSRSESTSSFESL